MAWLANGRAAPLEACTSPSGRRAPAAAAAPVRPAGTHVSCRSSRSSTPRCPAAGHHAPAGAAWHHVPPRPSPRRQQQRAPRPMPASKALGSTATVSPDHQPHARAAGSDGSSTSSPSQQQDRDQLLTERITNICIERETSAGHLTVRAVAESDVMGACVVLTRAFAGTPEEINLADARRYVDSVVSNPPRGVLFVARIVPTDASLLPPNQSSRLIGTVAMSLHEETMQQIPTLPPPPNSAYLSNMAVDSKFRRLGVARALMSACAEAARAAGIPEIYLHVRQGDEPAEQLYLSEGFVEVARDSFLAAKLKHVRPRILMKASV